MSSRAISRASGRWTLTTTSRPLGSVARCTWPSEAAASGSSSNSAKRWRIWPPSSASTISVTTSNPNGSASSWSRASAVVYAGGSRSKRVDSSWPSLMYVGPSSSRSRANAAAFASSPIGGSSSKENSSSPTPAIRSERP